MFSVCKLWRDSSTPHPSPLPENGERGCGGAQFFRGAGKEMAEEEGLSCALLEGFVFIRQIANHQFVAFFNFP